jgi:hypothetical protein
VAESMGSGGPVVVAMWLGLGVAFLGWRAQAFFKSVRGLYAVWHINGRAAMTMYRVWQDYCQAATAWGDLSGTHNLTTDGE